MGGYLMANNWIFFMLLLYSILFASLCTAGPINFQSKDNVQQAIHRMISRAQRLYVPAQDGAIKETIIADGYGIPWFESAIMWEAVMANVLLTGNEEFVPVTVGALANSSFGTESSFLGPPNLHSISANVLGRWNGIGILMQTILNGGLFLVLQAWKYMELMQKCLLVVLSKLQQLILQIKFGRIGTKKHAMEEYSGVEIRILKTKLPERHTNLQ
jgi:hypothetical protein